MDYEVTIAGLAPHRLTVTRTPVGATLWIDGRPHRGALAEGPDRRRVRLDDREADAHVLVDGDVAHVHALGRTWRVEVVDPAERSQLATAQADVITAPMPGSVITLPVAPGDAVVTGQPVVVIESMKMQSELTATRDGVVDRLHVMLGDTFDRGAPLVSLVPDAVGEEAT